MVEKKAGEKLVCLRTKRGGEFTSKEFNDFCQDQGISRQLTTSYTPQQNGVAEQKKQNNHEYGTLYADWKKSS